MEIVFSRANFSFWAKLFLYTYENQHVSELISNHKVKAYRFHSTKHFIDDIGTLNDGAVFNDFYRDICSPELQLKVEHSGSHGTFLNLDIPVKDGAFFYKHFDKRDEFRFLSFACLTVIVTSPNQYFILLLLVNSLE